MKLSVLTPSNDLKEKLMEISALVTAFQNKENSAWDNYFSWLQSTEELLKKYNYSIASSFASIRAELLAINFESISVKEKRKKRQHKALQTIQTAQITLHKKQQALDEKIEQVRTVLKQIIVVTKQAGMLQIERGQDMTYFLESFLMQLQQHKQVSATVNNAIASIGRFDVLRLLGEEIEFC